MFSSKPLATMCVVEEGGREFPSCPYNWSYSKEEERKDEEKKKGRWVVMAGV